MSPLIRFEPARGLRRELDRPFDDLVPSVAGDPGTAWAPALDLAETDEAFTAHLDLPGMNPDDIEIRFEDGMLSVRGERTHRVSEAREGLVRSERSFGSFYRAVRLPQQIDPDGVEAAFDNGVLTISLPKVAASQPRRIAIRAPEAVGAGGDGAPVPAEDVG